MIFGSVRVYGLGKQNNHSTRESPGMYSNVQCTPTYLSLPVTQLFFLSVGIMSETSATQQVESGSRTFERQTDRQTDTERERERERDGERERCSFHLRLCCVGCACELQGTS